MKKILLAIITTLLLACQGYALESQWVRGTDRYTSRAAVSATAITPIYLYRIQVRTDGTNAVTIQLYDEKFEDYVLDAQADGQVVVHPDDHFTTGSRVGPEYIITTSSTDRLQTLEFDGLKFERGIYVYSTVASNGSYEWAAYYLYESDMD